MTELSQMHARATKLAHDAMEAAAQKPITGMTDYQFAQADYARRLAEMRAENVQRHAANNNDLSAAAAQRKAERQAAHQARNQAAAAAAAARKLAKAA